MSVHVFYGHAKREPEPDEECMYCGARKKVMAYTYFGAPVCGRCWDGRWRQEEDGECDPPFAEITRKVSGEWLQASSPATEPHSEDDERCGAVHEAAKAICILPRGHDGDHCNTQGYWRPRPGEPSPASEPEEPSC